MLFPGFFMQNKERFSDRVENYIRFRPHYPLEILSFLKKVVGLNCQSVIADIGSGTGISSEIFLQNGNTVFAIEPDQAMRQAAEKAFHKNKKFISVNATAEETSLPDKSVDLIIVGQAFHWFNLVKSKTEFQRIATSNASVVLMWNDRKLETDFQCAYEKMLRDFALDYTNENLRNVDEKRICEFFSPCSVFSHTFANFQIFDFQSLKGRLLSSSYSPPEEHPNYLPMMNRLEKIFNEFSTDSKIRFEYDCNLYYGSLT